jgi:hypothetical protein
LELRISIPGGINHPIGQPDGMLEKDRRSVESAARQRFVTDPISCHKNWQVKLVAVFIS